MMPGTVFMARSALLIATSISVASACVRHAPVRDPIAPSYGEALYLAHCVACHGTTGAGDGPQAARQSVAPPDLRRISERNGGRYPMNRVRRVIDGRKPVKGHGDAGMPIWGDLLLEPRDGYAPQTAKDKVEHLARYLATLQDLPRH